MRGSFRGAAYSKHARSYAQSSKLASVPPPRRPRAPPPHAITRNTKRCAVEREGGSQSAVHVGGAKPDLMGLQQNSTTGRRLSRTGRVGVWRFEDRGRDRSGRRRVDLLCVAPPTLTEGRHISETEVLRFRSLWRLMTRWRQHRRGGRGSACARIFGMDAFGRRRQSSLCHLGSAWRRSCGNGDVEVGSRGPKCRSPADRRSTDRAGDAAGARPQAGGSQKPMPGRRRRGTREPRKLIVERCRVVAGAADRRCARDERPRAIAEHVGNRRGREETRSTTMPRSLISRTGVPADGR